jgi:hypothetical protein
MTENCPICNPKEPEEPEERNVAVLLRGRIASDPRPGNPDQKLFQLALNDIERLRVSVKSMLGQLQHVGRISTTHADVVKRVYKMEGGWEP